MSTPHLPEMFRSEAADIQESLDQAKTALLDGQIVALGSLEEKVVRLCRLMTEAPSDLHPSCLLLAEDILQRLDGLQKELVALFEGGTDAVG